MASAKYTLAGPLPCSLDAVKLGFYVGFYAFVRKFGVRFVFIICMQTCWTNFALVDSLSTAVLHILYPVVVANPIRGSMMAG